MFYSQMFFENTSSSTWEYSGKSECSSAGVGPTETFRLLVRELYETRGSQAISQDACCNYAAIVLGLY